MNQLLKGRIMVRVIFSFFTFLFLSGCGVETHFMKEQSKSAENCYPQVYGNTPKQIANYFGRIGDEETIKDDGTLVRIYHRRIGLEEDSTHWSGVVVWAFVPIIPLLLPTGHHETEFHFINNELESCIGRWHGKELYGIDFPQFH